MIGRLTIALLCALMVTFVVASTASAGLARETIYCGYVDVAPCDSGEAGNNFGFSNQRSVAVEHSLTATGDHVWFGATYSIGRLWGRAPLDGPTTDSDDEAITSLYTEPAGDFGDKIAGIAYDPTQNVIFFDDRNNSRVLAFHRNALGSPDSIDQTLPAQAPGPVTNGSPGEGSGPGQFESFGDSSGMAWSTFNQRLYVTDAWNARVQIFSYEYGDGGAVEPSLDYEGEFSANWNSDDTLPRDVAVDAATGNVFVADGGGFEGWSADLIRVFDADGNELDSIGSGTGGGSAEDVSVAVDSTNRLLYSVKRSYIDVYSLYTGAKLGTFPSTDFKTVPGDNIYDVDIDPVSRSLYVVLGTSGATAALDNPTAAGYALDAPPACTVAAPITVALGESVTIPTNCTDADGAVVKQFHRDTPPASGSITPNADRSALTFTAGNTPGTVEARYRVMTMNGRSPVYSQTINVAAPPPPAQHLTPVVRKTANLEPLSGVVLIKLPGSNEWIPLSEATLIPVGTVIDARKGKAHLTFANADGTLQDGIFWEGIFQVSQGSGDKPIVTLKLRDDLAAKATASIASLVATPAGFKAWTAKKRGKKKNGLWGDAKGKYRTSGKGGSATVRGTRWYVADYANGSLFKVAKGSVTIDPIRGKNFVLKAGKQFFIFYKKNP